MAYRADMSVMIQICNVCEKIHRALKTRSALAGKSLSDLILDELVAMIVVPSNAELKARLGNAGPFAVKKSSATIVRRERDAA